MRLPPSHPIPEWILSAASSAASSHFLSITKTNDELSLVCPESIVPTTDAATTSDLPLIEKGWVSFKVQGPLDFAWTGILAGLAQPLAAQGISIFAISTYDTDYILVKHDVMDQTAKVLTELGHAVVVVDEAEAAS